MQEFLGLTAWSSLNRLRQSPVFNFAPRGEIYPLGVILSPRAEDHRFVSPFSGVNKGVNIPLVVKVHP
jgi:hypothetical protein